MAETTEEVLVPAAPDSTANDEERTLIEKLIASKAKVEKLELELKVLKGEYDETDRKLMSLLEEDGKKATAKYKGLGYVVIVEGAAQASIEKGRQPDVIKQLTEIGRTDMIKTTVAAATLSVYVRDCLKQNLPVPEGVNYYHPKWTRFCPEKS